MDFVPEQKESDGRDVDVASHGEFEVVLISGSRNVWLTMRTPSLSLREIRTSESRHHGILGWSRDRRCRLPKTHRERVGRRTRRAETYTNLEQGLEETIQSLQHAGRQVIVVRDIPVFGFDPMRRIWSRYIPIRRPSSQRSLSQRGRRRYGAAQRNLRCSGHKRRKSQT